MKSPDNQDTDTPLPDREAVIASLRDREMFRVLVQKYQPVLLRYVSRLGADAETAKDVVQESFIKAYVNLNDFDQSQSFSAWIYRIAHNQAMDHFRKQRNLPRPMEHADSTHAFEMIAADLDIERELDVKMLAASMQDALKQVRPQYLEVLLLRFFEEKSYEEIADILQVPQGTVSTYLTRGKAELRAVLLAQADNRHIL